MVLQITKEIQREDIEELINEDYSFKQLASHFGVSVTVINNWLKKFSLKTKHQRGGTTKDRKPHLCRNCGDTNPNNFRVKKKGLCIKCQRVYQTEQHNKRKAILVQYMGGKCIICGYQTSLSALDFHHLNPDTKEHSIYRTGNIKNTSLDKAKEELTKCILVCSNCHREIHFGLHPQYLEKGL